jgi:hypothetical protein
MMHWDLSWQYPLLINDEGFVIAKDNSPSPEGVIYLDGTQKREEFIAEAERFWQDLLDEMDGK